jgi:putative transposase
MSDVKAKGRGGRKPMLGEAHQRLLSELIVELPQSSLGELTREFNRRSGLNVCGATVRKALVRAGITRIQAARGPAPGSGASKGQSKRVGYTQAHRRQDGASGLNTDLTDAEWALLCDVFERTGGPGAPSRHDKRVLLNACLYVVRTGCSWRLLPKSFPPWRAVYKAFRNWAQAGAFETMHDRLRQQWRERLGRTADPSAAVIDAQSTRATAQGGNTGYDAGKKVKGRKRHLLVDTLGLLLAVTVTAASVQDRDAAAAVVAMGCKKIPGLKALFADAAYAGQCAQALEDTHGIVVRIVRRSDSRATGTWQQAQLPLWSAPEPKGFVVQPKRWVVERTHAWNERARRLMAHHDRSDWAPVAWVWLTETRILATRLATAIN